ncbi:hypothetical protein J2T17_006395 [Paenibacillus mucilaginosus]|uniref:hypothetical protein n=1 Tax=Paenibacillus mucilaginosus TaxID=61624 RepID=UPI003D24E504
MPYNIDDATYQEAKKLACVFLKDAASLGREGGRYFTYAELSAFLAEMGLDIPHHGLAMNAILDEISTDELEQGRPLLSALVILKDGNRPGSGFFKMARERGKYKGRSKDDEEVFWISELNAVYDYWDFRKAK